MELWTQLKAKGLLHWFWVFVLITVGIFVGRSLSEYEIWVDLRYKIYQRLHTLSPRKPLPERTVLVLIGDEEYWKGELGRRVPIKRTYLARLLAALDNAHPAVIAIDFDLSSPVQDGSVIEHPDYRDERDEFLAVIRKIALHRKIVIPKTIRLDQHGEYTLGSDIYDGFDFGRAKNNIYTGYIALPYDIRQIPLSLKLKAGEIDSFATAIVKADSPDALKRVPQGDTLPYGSYIDKQSFLTVSARDVLQQKADALQSLAHKIVIVGGTWHRLGYQRGRQIDVYFTPLGWTEGVFIHANYAEAILDGRIYTAMKADFVIVIEILLALAAAIVFAISIRPIIKWLVALFFLLALFSASYVLLQNLGTFFEAFVPLILIGGHSLVEQIIEWRERALKYSGEKR